MIEWSLLVLDVPIVAALVYLIIKQRAQFAAQAEVVAIQKRAADEPRRAQNIERYIRNHPDCLSYREAAKAVGNDVR